MQKLSMPFSKNDTSYQNFSVSELEARKTLYQPILNFQARTSTLIPQRASQYLKIGGTPKTGKYNSKKRKHAKGTFEFDSPSRAARNIKIVSCIFKVNDDLR